MPEITEEQWRQARRQEHTLTVVYPDQNGKQRKLRYDIFATP